MYRRTFGAIRTFYLKESLREKRKTKMGKDTKNSFAFYLAQSTVPTPPMSFPAALMCGVNVIFVPDSNSLSQLLPLYTASARGLPSGLAKSGDQ